MITLLILFEIGFLFCFLKNYKNTGNIFEIDITELYYIEFVSLLLGWIINIILICIFCIKHLP
jgi:hypothetical protein